MGPCEVGLGDIEMIGKDILFSVCRFDCASFEGWACLCKVYFKAQYFGPFSLPYTLPLVLI